jgi:hypothetical protein
VVTFSLLVGGAFLLLVLQSSLISAEWNNLALRASDVARLLDEEGLRETQSTLAEDRRSSEQVQIIDSTNQVVAWSARRLRGEPISALRPAPGKTAKEQLPRVPALGQDDEVLVSARGVEAKDQAYVVLVAEPLEVQTDTLRSRWSAERYGYWSVSHSRQWNVSVGRWQRSTVSGSAGAWRCRRLATKLPRWQSR